MLVQCDFGGFSLHCTPACPLLWGVNIHINHLYNLGFCMPVFRANLYCVFCHHEAGVLWGKPSLPGSVGSEMMMKKGYRCERWKDNSSKQRACCWGSSCLWPCQPGGCSSTLGKVARVGPIAKASCQLCSRQLRSAAGSKAVVLESEAGISGGWERKCLGVAWQQA